MKVLLLGATGNLGLRMVPALLTHNHTVTAFVRSSRKLESALPQDVFSRLTVVEGDAKNSSSVKNAILSNNCDAVVSTAGVAAVMPWGKSDLPEIFKAVLDAVVEAGRERGKPLRVWFLGGTSILFFPGTENLMLNHLPLYTTHKPNLALIRSLPKDSVHWSILCPMVMEPSSEDLSVPTKASSQARLVTQAWTPPNWNLSWIVHVPVIGKTLNVMMNAQRYTTKLEQNAEVIAADLEEGEASKFIGCPVGVIDGSR